MSTKPATNHSKTTASVGTNTCVVHLASEAETVTDNYLSNTHIFSQVETLTDYSECNYSLIIPELPIIQVNREIRSDLHSSSGISLSSFDIKVYVHNKEL